MTTGKIRPGAVTAMAWVEGPQLGFTTTTEGSTVLATAALAGRTFGDNGNGVGSVSMRLSVYVGGVLRDLRLRFLAGPTNFAQWSHAILPVRLGAGTVLDFRIEADVGDGWTLATGENHAGSSITAVEYKR